MTTLLFGLIYLSLAVSAVACVVRAVRYARLPLNLRWELYPVPREAARHAGHGGSYFEDLDWWTKPSRPNHLGELKAMGAEILFLQAMYLHNRRLWRWSYPFHLGLYVLIVTAVAAALCAFVKIVPPSIIDAAGIVGCVLVMAGAAGLLVHRIKDPELRNYSAPMDYVNLCFFIATSALLLISAVTGSGPGLIAMLRALLTFDTSVAVPIPHAVALAMAALLIAYIPMTHMAHFIGKYFMWHAIRWGGREGSVADYLGYTPTWSARHIGADGATSWAEIVTRNPTTEKSK